MRPWPVRGPCSSTCATRSLATSASRFSGSIATRRPSPSLRSRRTARSFTTSCTLTRCTTGSASLAAVAAAFPSWAAFTFRSAGLLGSCAQRFRRLASRPSSRASKTRCTPAPRAASAASRTSLLTLSRPFPTTSLATGARRRRHVWSWPSAPPALATTARCRRRSSRATASSRCVGPRRTSCASSRPRGEASRSSTWRSRSTRIARASAAAHAAAGSCTRATRRRSA